MEGGIGVQLLWEFPLLLPLALYEGTKRLCCFEVVLCETQAKGEMSYHHRAPLGMVEMNPETINAILKWVAFGCFLEWGLIHLMAGGIVLSGAFKGDLAKPLVGICEAAPQSLKREVENTRKWSDLNVRILIQHGFNLFFVGIWSLLDCYFVLQLNRWSFFLSLWPWMADVAYFIAIDLKHYGSVVAEAQTYIISTALVCTAFLMKEKFEVSPVEFYVCAAAPCGLILAAIVNKVVACVHGQQKEGAFVEPEEDY
uniref:Uncharacterized protein n=1 Tax=Chromera velia CCMP2878 TaxID=1169474 RepID=A0A0G4F710_9ALVE|eukprot:Cvel_15403.t1-p1 / transcript=Cvel_15403.t1 / gene=Cvel_15403 / organism=Chromera_velia_CCMP2878 / gene_product=hypothetical protein / transcript_product=hypothetical protein / location=Cvel_scaffold1137:45715-49316(-) / protein_length=254 / sequence_SO=supercontig / SO=protein_coding / is_pseudo=false